MRAHEMYAYRRFSRNVVGILALMFIISGLIKFFGPAMLPQTFADWGYPSWFAYIVGLLEIGGGLLMLGQRSCFYGASVLALIMFGAFFTHVVHGESMQAVVPLAMMALLFMVARLYSEGVVHQVERLLLWYELDGQENRYQH
ncbi:MAG: DoxX family protein [Candidatus Sericytochromatia bacterium]